MEKTQSINFIITDLDDTIWDWLGMWHNSFEPYVRRISEETGIKYDDLINDFKVLHEKYGTTESSFVYEELKSLNEIQKELIANSNSPKKKSIIHEYYSNKKNNLKLYDGVLDTLKYIKSQGAVIVGFTESNAFFTKYRIKHLDLDGIFDCIYAPIDSGIPSSVYRHYPETFWEPNLTEFRYLSKNIRKPDSEILDIIISDFKAEKEKTIYIGDKLDRDIHMAQQADITSVYAKYGHQIHTTEYDLLKKVTHWTQADVERELQFKNNFSSLKPPDTILNSFNELMSRFSFDEFKKPSVSIDNIIQIWTKVIDVQQHFNDIELRIRNFTLTIITFILAGIGYAEKEHFIIQKGNFILNIPATLSFVGVLIIAALFFMDKYWYHRLLKGAVTQGIEIEKKWGGKIPEMMLTAAIGKASPIQLTKKIKIHSDHKYLIFYFPLLVFFISLTILLYIF